MKSKELITVLVIMIVSSVNIYSQDYFIVNKDTTFCSNLEYTTTAQGYLKSIKYIDENNIEKSIEGRKKVPNVVTFYIDSVAYDKTPLKANKPNSYIRYTKRVVDGKLKVYLGSQANNSGTMIYNPSSHSSFNHNGWESTGGPSGIYRFYLKVPNGTYYKINSKKNMKKYIKPYLLKCAKFSSEYKGDFSTREEPFINMINLYNSLCE